MEIEDILYKAKERCEKFLDKNKDGTIIIWGATATGKSKLSLLLSDFFSIELISSDSRQIFRKMDIGTDKVTKQRREKVPHHQIDIVNPDETYTAGQWKVDSENVVEDILQRGKTPIIVGGTGLYIDTIYKNFLMPECPPNYEYRKELETLEKQNPGTVHRLLTEIDPEEAKKLHPNATRYIIRALEIHHEIGKTKTELFLHQKVKHPTLMIGLWRDKEESIRRINKRIKEMIQIGLVDEVKGLLDEGYSKNLQSMNGIGYKEVIGYLEGEYDINEMERLLQMNTQHLAKRQRTRFRRYIAEGKDCPRENVEYELYEL